MKHENYRKDLAETIRSVPHNERRKILEQARQTKEYQESDIFYIQKRFRDELDSEHQEWKKTNILLDNMECGQKFMGATGEYEILKFDPDMGLLETIVRDKNGKEFFISNKRAKEQSLASLIGGYLVGKNSKLARLHFPEIRLENINGQIVSLMEYFKDYKELPFDRETEEDFTEDEKAFLQVYNLWIGNWDYKYDHLLVSKNNKEEKALGLIDLEWSFDFDNPERLTETSTKSIFLGSVDHQKINEYLQEIENLDIMDRNKIIKYSVQSGFDPNEVIKIILKLFERREDVRTEESVVEEQYRAFSDIGLDRAA